MRKLTKLALFIGCISAASTLNAGQLTLQLPGYDEDNSKVLELAFSKLEVISSSAIVVHGTDYEADHFDDSVLQCDPATTDRVGDLCVGKAGAGSSSSASSSSTSSSSSSSSSSTSSSSSSSSISVPGSCGTAPAGVVVEGALMDWSFGTSQLTLNLSKNNIHAYPITTTSNPDFNGQFSLVPFSNTGLVGKNVWISACPGGAPEAPVSRCSIDNQLEPTIFWEQKSKTKIRCQLTTNKTYYVNVQNAEGGCTSSSGCNAKLQHLVNGSPD